MEDQVASSEAAGTTPTVKFQEGDRVRQVGNVGPLGTVMKVRIERTRQSIKESGNDSPGVSVMVLWDNGTTSHFVTESLEKAKH